jgi:hypothetical protein
MQVVLVGALAELQGMTQVTPGMTVVAHLTVVAGVVVVAVVLTVSTSLLAVPVEVETN